MDNQELRELVNPVFNTAKSCVQLDAAAGDADAQRLLDALGFEPFGAQMSKKPVPKELHEQVKRLFPAYTILIESRFQAMNRLIEKMESRPIPGKNWEYLFFLEFSGDLTAPGMDGVLHELSQLASQFRVLGNFRGYRP